ncbi:MAG: hypothetical protein QNJ65_04940 [Xenococcaceae cyanobacterium MO_234.B1]|nr:hypothetical protein [Xenococcaceae cyanobacterium MO_234.B1]
MCSVQELFRSDRTDTVNDYEDGYATDCECLLERDRTDPVNDYRISQ